MGGPANSVFILMGLLAVLALPIGLLLLFLGIRGKRVGNVPTCGSCGFDVTGISIDSSSKCPECGTTLGSNVKPGKNYKRRRLIMSGLVLLLFVGGYASIVLSRGGWTQLNPYKPPFLLSAEVSLGGNLRRSALDEFAKRVSSGKLSTSTVNDLLQEALALQADTKQTWILEYGNFVDAAHSSGKVSASDWKQYVLATLHTEFEISSTITSGDPVVFLIKTGSARSGFSSSFQGIITASEIKIDGNPVEMPATSLQVSYVPSPYTSMTAMEKLDSSSLAPGTHEIEVTLKTRVTNDAAVTREELKKFPIKILPKGTAAHVTKSDAALADQMRDGIRIEKITITELKPGKAKTDCTITCANLPMAAAFDLIVKYLDRDGIPRELIVTSLATRAIGATASNTSGTGGEIDVSSEVLNKIATAGLSEIEIRPNLEIAKRQTNMYEIWGQPIKSQFKVNIVLTNPTGK